MEYIFIHIDSFGVKVHFIIIIIYCIYFIFIVYILAIRIALIFQIHIYIYLIHSFLSDYFVNFTYICWKRSCLLIRARKIYVF